MNLCIKVLIFIFTVLVLIVSILYCLLIIGLTLSDQAPDSYLVYGLVLFVVCFTNLVMYLVFFFRKQNYLILYIDIIFAILGIIAAFYGKEVTLYGAPWFISGILNTIISNEQQIDDDIPQILN